MEEDARDEAVPLLSHASPRTRASHRETKAVECWGACARPLCAAVRHVLPPLTWLPQYGTAELAGDALAGVTVGLTVLPQALAYAALAGLPPQYGLYSAFMGCFIYALFGTAKDVSIGPTAVMALLVGQFAVSPVPHDATLAVLLTFGCGVIQVVFGIFRLGFAVNFISYPVISAFTSAAAVTIAFGEVKGLLGLKNIRQSFFESVYDTFSRLPTANPWDAVMGIVSITFLVAFGEVRRRVIEPRLRTAPLGGCRHKALKAVWVLFTGRNAVVLLVASGVAAIVYDVYGLVHAFTLTERPVPGLPPFRLPSFSINATVGNTTIYRDAGQLFESLGVGFIVVSLIGILEQVAVGQAFARANSYKINSNQEIFALGLANIFSSFVSSYPVTASFSKSAINAASGVRTPAGGLWTGALVLIALAFLTPYFSYIPNAALAAVIFVAVLDMVNWRIAVDMWKIKKLDLVPFVLTFALSFPWGIEYGILIGAGVSLLILLYPMARPELKTIPAATLSEHYRNGAGHNNRLTGNEAVTQSMAGFGSSGLAMLCPSRGLEFPAVDHICTEALRRGLGAEPPCSLALDCSHVTTIDYTAVHALTSIGELFEKHKLKLFIVGATADVSCTLARARRNDVLLIAPDFEAAVATLCNTLSPQSLSTLNSVLLNGSGGGDAVIGHSRAPELVISQLSAVRECDAITKSPH